RGASAQRAGRPDRRRADQGQGAARARRRDPAVADGAVGRSSVSGRRIARREALVARFVGLGPLALRPVGHRLWSGIAHRGEILLAALAGSKRGMLAALVL